MQTAGLTRSSDQKSKHNHLDEFLPLYKKFDETNELKTRQKQAVNISQIIIDGTNLNNSGGNSTPRELSKVTSTPLFKKLAKSDKKHKKSTPTTEPRLAQDNVSINLSNSKSTKRSKSVSFLLKEKEQAVVKKSKSDDLNNGAAGDPPLKVKKQKHKKNKKSEKDKADKTETVETHSNPDNETEECSYIKEKKIKKKKKEKPATEAILDILELKKCKKQRHQEKDECNGEPTSKSPKPHLIADNLENLNLGDNTHSLTNLIEEMVVVDKGKKKKLRKTDNRVKNLDESSQKENGDPNNEVQTEKKKWLGKRWNKQQVAERDQTTTIHVDNLPVSLLRGNFKKALIDHFSKYGLSRSVGEPVTQNEEDVNPVFTTKMFFNDAIAATEALEMDGTIIAGNRIRVSPMRPMTETVLVIRIYSNPKNLGDKYIRTTFQDVGLIRSIKPMLRKKKTMATVFVEFDSPEAVQKALNKCENLTLNGKKIMANAFSVRTQLKKRKRSRGKGSKVQKEADEDSGSDDSSDE